MELEEFVGLFKQERIINATQVTIIAPLTDLDLQNIYSYLDKKGLAKDLNPKYAKAIVCAYGIGRKTGFVDGACLSFDFAREFINGFYQSRENFARFP